LALNKRKSRRSRWRLKNDNSWFHRSHFLFFEVHVAGIQ
jgi:hypothetical protein